MSMVRVADRGATGGQPPAPPADIYEKMKSGARVL